MISKLQNIITKNTSGKNVLFFLLPTLGVYATMLLFSIPKVLQHSNGMEILDLIPTGYSADYAQKLFETLGEIGREVYLFQQLPLDMIYPGLFAISFSLLLTLIFKESFSKENAIQKANVLPLFVGCLDYLENIGTIVMLSIYPGFHDWIANTTSTFSVLKSVSTISVFILLVVGIIGLLIKQYKVRKAV